MVRREEQQQRARCTVLLDTRQVGYEGAGPESAFEWAVSGAASALVHLLERGFAVRLLTDTGRSVPGEGAEGFAGSSHQSADTAGLMMDTLAVVDHSDGTGLSRAYEVLRGGNEGLLVAFLGDLDDDQTAVVGRMRQRAGAAVAFVLDSSARLQDGGDLPAPVQERLRRLRESGWTVLPVPAGAALPELWQQAAHQRAESGTTPGSAGFSGGWS